jgi:hypothetical protein
MSTYCKGYAQGFITTLVWFNNPILANYMGMINGLYCLIQESQNVSGR